MRCYEVIVCLLDDNRSYEMTIKYYVHVFLEICYHFLVLMYTHNCWYCIVK